MIILDTNIISEVGGARPDPIVRGWLAAQSIRNVYVAAISEAEMRFGWRKLPEGQRKRDLDQRLTQLFEGVFGGRVLSFDRGAAPFYAEIADLKRRAGRASAELDTMIAAICIAKDMQLATRNTRDFEDVGVTVINPFEF